MEDRVIPDVMNDVFLLQGRYPENFVLISLLEVCQEGGPRREILGGCLGFLMGHLEDRVILDDMDDLGRPQGSYPEGFVSLSLFLAEIYKLVVLVKKHDIHTYIHTYIRQTLEKFNIDINYIYMRNCLEMIK